jgi:glycosyltransferase involved in cell wall biosynthesis
MTDAEGYRRFAVLVPGALSTPTGGFVYDRAMVEAMARANRLDRLIELPGSYPFIDGRTLARAGEALAVLADRTALIVDGLALTPLAPVLHPIARRHPVIALVHHPLGDETGLAPRVREDLLAAERDALAMASHIIVTSETTAARLKALHMGNGPISVVRPGVARRRPHLRHRRRLGEPVLLTVGALVPRKGQDVLIRALAGLQDRPWRLWLAGPPRDPRFARRLRRLIRARGLGQRVRVWDAVSASRLDALYRGADLFILPSRHEGYGIVVAEAIAHGLPIIASRAGAIPEAMPRGTGLLVPPEDPVSLRRAIERVLREPPLRMGLVRTCRRAASGLRSWRDAGGEFLAVLDRIGGR